MLFNFTSNGNDVTAVIAKTEKEAWNKLRKCGIRNLCGEISVTKVDMYD